MIVKAAKISGLKFYLSKPNVSVIAAMERLIFLRSIRYVKAD